MKMQREQTVPTIPLANNPIIEIKGLSWAYGTKPAFADISLAVDQGCVTALVGPSGCGKSSFLQTLNRMTDLIPSCRVSGTDLLESSGRLDCGLYQRL